MAFPQVIPSLFVVELEAATGRLRYKLVGTLADEYAGIRMAGRYLGEFMTGQTEQSARFFDSIYRRLRAPACSRLNR